MFLFAFFCLVHCLSWIVFFFFFFFFGRVRGGVGGWREVGFV